MYEKRLTFSWNRQPSHLLIYQDVRLLANDLEPELRCFFHRLSRRPAQHRRERGAA